MIQSSVTLPKNTPPSHVDYKALALLPLAGLASGILTSILLGLPRVELFAGIIFGGLVGGWLSRAKALRSEEWAWFTVVATADFVLSLCAVVFAGVALGFPFGTRSPVGWAEPVSAASFCGGSFGGLVLLASLPLIRREARGGSVIFKAVVGAVCGGALEILGAALAPSLGSVFVGLVHWVHLPTETNGQYGDPNFVYSVLLVWQTGMAALAALTLLRYNVATGNTAASPKWFSGEPDSGRTNEEQQ